jgi:serine/threonine protein kinase
MSNLPPIAASSSPALDEYDALPAGTRFGELEILRVVAVGGFGIVYLARDHSLDREVALKEYMPGQLAARGPSAQVSVRSGSHMETFVLGLRSFVNEARLLARFDHRSLVKVYRFWEANNTAYMVMPFLQGRTLREARRAMTTPPDEAWMRQTFNPLLEALELLHREAVYHRDIAPDNILLPNDGSQAVLLDFGAARRAIGDRTQTFTAILKPSYAPIEQYAESITLRQGPWTDIYALGAAIHYVIKGLPPPPATARTIEDHIEVLANMAIPGVSPGYLAAVDWALAVRPQDRPQSVAEFRNALDGKITPPTVFRQTTGPAIAADPYAKTIVDTAIEKQPISPAIEPLVPRSGWGAWPVAIPAVLLLLAAAAWWSTRAPEVAEAADLTGLTGAAPKAAASAASTVSVPTPVAAAATVPTPPLAAPVTVVAPSPKLPAPVARPAENDTSAPRIVLGAKPTRSTDSGNKPVVPNETPAATDQRAAGAPLWPTAPSARPAKPRAQTATAGFTSPTEACGGRVFIALLHCIERQCNSGRFTSHPQCAEVRARKEQPTQDVYGGGR